MTLSSRAKKFQDNIKFVQAVAVALFAASGLVIGACLSGLPSTLCGQLAHTYYEAIHNFGNVVALTAFSLVAIYGFEERNVDREKKTFVFIYISSFIATALAIVVFGIALSNGYEGLGASMKQCYTQAAPSH